MIKRKNKIHIEQLDRKINQFLPLVSVPNPTAGWINAVRTALNISLNQWAKKINISGPSLKELEIREKEGSITIKKLKEVAEALDLKLVYGLVPKDGSLKKLIERKARETAMEIVLRTSQNMKLEDQENSQERITAAIQERAEELQNELPKILWD